MMRKILILCLVLFLVGCEEEKKQKDLPQSLPFVLTREDVGEPLSQQEITDFTLRLTSLWKKINYFRWVIWTSHGCDQSTGLPDYLLWWDDVNAIKQGPLVTFQNSLSGGGHNIMIPTSRVLAQAACGYLLTGDQYMGKVTEQFSKGVAATCQGMVYDKNDPLLYLMSRNITNQNHSFELEGGRQKAVDYSLWHSEYQRWNAHRFNYKNNPYWGDIWVTNMRSKDDVPHLYAATAWLKYVKRYGKDKKVRDAAALGLEFVTGFCKDIVDSGYYIRTKDKYGNPYIPDEDLASFVRYEGAIPNAECNAKLSSALIAYGEPLGNDCGKGWGNLYEYYAALAHYYNYQIFLTFHLSAILHSLILEQNDIALELLQGMIERLDHYQDPQADVPCRETHPQWKRDQAVFYLRCAAAGVPLTSREVRAIHEIYSKAVEQFQNWDRWDLWDPSVPDGTYDHRSGFRPANGPDYAEIEDLAFLLEYCYSPFKNPNGVAPCDCDIVSDPQKW